MSMNLKLRKFQVDPDCKILENNNNTDLSQTVTPSFKKMIVSQVPKVEEPDDDNDAEWEGMYNLLLCRV